MTEVSKVPDCQIPAFQALHARILISLGLLCLLPVAAAEETEQSERAPTYFAQIEEELGNVKIDGTLRLGYPLGETAELNFLGIRCVLEHRIETDAYGRARSAWRISGLQTSLAPVGREHLRWQPLAGRPVRFLRSEIGRALDPAGAPPWLIRITAPGDYEIRNPDGRVWRYGGGLLQRIEHPVLGKVIVEGQGGLVREISRKDGEEPLLRVEYDEWMRLVSLSLGSSEGHRFQWSDAGELLEWQRLDGRKVSFSYRNGLLAKVQEQGGAERQFSWAENHGHGRGGSRWPRPAHLSSDGENDYSYRLTRKGFILRRHNRTNGKEAVAVFNPRRRTLKLRREIDALHASFRRDPAYAVDRVTDGRGRVLEEYRYDDQNRLVEVLRHGESVQTFGYDVSGRRIPIQYNNQKQEFK